VPGPRRTSCAIGRGRTGAAAAGTHRVADAEPADPAVGGDGRHAAAAAQAGGRPADRGGQRAGGIPGRAVAHRSRDKPTRQAAGLGRPQLRSVVPPSLPEDLVVDVASRLRRTAATAGVEVAWIEAPLDGEFSSVCQHRTDAGLDRRSPIVGRVHRYGPRPSRRISPDRRGKPATVGFPALAQPDSPPRAGTAPSRPAAHRGPLPPRRAGPGPVTGAAPAMDALV
jgi:hypothetical protein